MTGARPSSEDVGEPKAKFKLVVVEFSTVGAVIEESVARRHLGGLITRTTR